MVFSHGKSKSVTDENAAKKAIMSVDWMFDPLMGIAQNTSHTDG
jgi:hypothetical protein